MSFRETPSTSAPVVSGSSPREEEKQSSRRERSASRNDSNKITGNHDNDNMASNGEKKNSETRNHSQRNQRKANETEEERQVRKQRERESHRTKNDGQHATKADKADNSNHRKRSASSTDKKKRSGKGDEEGSRKRKDGIREQGKSEEDANPQRGSSASPPPKANQQHSNRHSPPSSPPTAAAAAPSAVGNGSFGGRNHLHNQHSSSGARMFSGIGGAYDEDDDDDDEDSDEEGSTSGRRSKNNNASSGGGSGGNSNANGTLLGNNSFIQHVPLVNNVHNLLFKHVKIVAPWRLKLRRKLFPYAIRRSAKQEAKEREREEREAAKNNKKNNNQKRKKKSAEEESLEKKKLTNRGVFDWAMTLVNIAVIIVSASHDYTDKNCSQTRCHVLLGLDAAITLIFFIETALHMMAFGVRKYLHPFRLADLAILITNAVLLILFLGGGGGGNLQDANGGATRSDDLAPLGSDRMLAVWPSLLILRVMRVFRPMITTTRFPQLRILIVALFKSLFQLTDVVLLFIILLLWFAVAGTNQMSGMLRKTCIHKSYFKGNAIVGNYPHYATYDNGSTTPSSNSAKDGGSGGDDVNREETNSVSWEDMTIGESLLDFDSIGRWNWLENEFEDSDDNSSSSSSSAKLFTSYPPPAAWWPFYFTERTMDSYRCGYFEVWHSAFLRFNSTLEFCVQNASSSSASSVTRQQHFTLVKNCLYQEYFFINSTAYEAMNFTKYNISENSGTAHPLYPQFVRNPNASVLIPFELQRLADGDLDNAFLGGFRDRRPQRQQRRSSSSSSTPKTSFYTTTLADFAAGNGFSYGQGSGGRAPDSCSPYQTCTVPGKSLMTGYTCPTDYICTDSEEATFFFGYVGFDGILPSLLTVFISVSFQLWYQVMYMAYDVDAFLVFLFFVALVVIGGILVTQLTTVIITVEFEKAQEEENQRVLATKTEQTAVLDSFASVVQRLVRLARIARAADAEDKKQQQRPRMFDMTGMDGNGNMNGTASVAGVDGNMPRVPSNSSALDSNGESNQATTIDLSRLAEIQAQQQRLGGGGSGGGSNNTPPPPATSTKAEKKAAKAERIANLAETALEWYMKLQRTREWVNHNIVATAAFEYASLLVILINTMFMCLEREGMPEDEALLYQELNYFFVSFWSMEFLLRLFAAPDVMLYLKLQMTWLDILVVAGMWIDVFLTSTSYRIPFLGGVRSIKVFKLLTLFPKLYVWLQLILHALVTAPMALFVFFFTVIIFACLFLNTLGGQLCGTDLEGTNTFNFGGMTVNPNYLKETAEDNFLYDPMTGEYLPIDFWTNPIYGSGDGSPRPSTTIRTSTGAPITTTSAENNIPPPETTAAPTTINFASLVDASNICEGLPRANFDGMWMAFVTSFQIATGDDWELVMYTAMQSKGVFMVIPFVLYFYLTAYMLLPLLVGIVLTAKEDDGNGGGAPNPASENSAMTSGGVESSLKLSRGEGGNDDGDEEMMEVDEDPDGGGMNAPLLLSGSPMSVSERLRMRSRERAMTYRSNNFPSSSTAANNNATTTSVSYSPPQMQHRSDNDVNRGADDAVASRTNSYHDNNHLFVSYTYNPDGTRNVDLNVAHLVVNNTYNKNHNRNIYSSSSNSNAPIRGDGGGGGGGNSQHLSVPNSSGGRQRANSFTAIRNNTSIPLVARILEEKRLRKQLAMQRTKTELKSQTRNRAMSFLPSALYNANGASRGHKNLSSHASGDGDARGGPPLMLGGRLHHDLWPTSSDEDDDINNDALLFGGGGGGAAATAGPPPSVHTAASTAYSPVNNDGGGLDDLPLPHIFVDEVPSDDGGGGGGFDHTFANTNHANNNGAVGRTVSADMRFLSAEIGGGGGVSRTRSGSQNSGGGGGGSSYNSSRRSSHSHSPLNSGGEDDRSRSSFYTGDDDGGESMTPSDDRHRRHHQQRRGSHQSGGSSSNQNNNSSVAISEIDEDPLGKKKEGSTAENGAADASAAVVGDEPFISRMFAYLPTRKQVRRVMRRKQRNFLDAVDRKGDVMRNYAVKYAPWWLTFSQICLRLSNQTLYRLAIAVITLYGTVVLCLKNMLAAPDSYEQKNLNTMEAVYVGFALFDVFFIRAIGNGLFFNKKALLFRSGSWENTDALLALISLISLVVDDEPSFFTDDAINETLRIVRSIRPVMALQYLPGCALITSTLGSSVTQLGRVTAVTFLAMFVLAIEGVRQYRGLLRICYVPTMGYVDDVSHSQCNEIEGGVWTNDGAHFDHLGAALQAVFSISTLEGWADVMHRMMDQAPDSDMARQRLSSPIAALYPMLVVIVVGFILSSLFASVLVDSYNKEKRLKGDKSVVTERQIDGYMLTQRRIFRSLTIPLQRKFLQSNPVLLGTLDLGLMSNIVPVSALSEIKEVGNFMKSNVQQGTLQLTKAAEGATMHLSKAAEGATIHLSKAAEGATSMGRKMATGVSNAAAAASPISAIVNTLQTRRSNSIAATSAASGETPNSAAVNSANAAMSSGGADNTPKATATASLPMPLSTDLGPTNASIASAASVTKGKEKIPKKDKKRKKQDEEAEEEAAGADEDALLGSRMMMHRGDNHADDEDVPPPRPPQSPTVTATTKQKSHSQFNLNHSLFVVEGLEEVPLASPPDTPPPPRLYEMMMMDGGDVGSNNKNNKSLAQFPPLRLDDDDDTPPPRLSVCQAENAPPTNHHNDDNEASEFVVVDENDLKGGDRTSASSSPLANNTFIGATPALLGALKSKTLEELGAATRLLSGDNENLDRGRSRLRAFVRSQLFINIFHFIVLVNIAALSWVTYPLSDIENNTQIGFDITFAVIFSLEFLLKVFAETIMGYFASNWNRLDFFVLVMSIAGVSVSNITGGGRSFALITSFRIVRLVRLADGTLNIRDLISKISKALASLGNVIIVIAAFFTVFSIVGMELFGRVQNGVYGSTAGFDKHNNFWNVNNGLMLLLRIMTGGNWPDLLASSKQEPETSNCDPQLNGCGRAEPIPQFFYIIFLSLSVYILKNLVVAVLVDAFTASGQLVAENKANTQAFCSAWLQCEDEEGEEASGGGGGGTETTADGGGGTVTGVKKEREKRLALRPVQILRFLRMIPKDSVLGFNHLPGPKRVALELTFFTRLQISDMKEEIGFASVVDVLCELSFNEISTTEAPMNRMFHYTEPASTAARNAARQARHDAAMARQQRREDRIAAGLPPDADGEMTEAQEALLEAERLKNNVDEFGYNIEDVNDDDAMERYSRNAAGVLIGGAVVAMRRRRRQRQVQMAERSRAATAAAMAEKEQRRRTQLLRQIEDDDDDEDDDGF